MECQQVRSWANKMAYYRFPMFAFFREKIESRNWFTMRNVTVTWNTRRSCSKHDTSALILLFSSLLCPVFVASLTQGWKMTIAVDGPLNLNKHTLVHIVVFLSGHFLWCLLAFCCWFQCRNSGLWVLLLDFCPCFYFDVSLVVVVVFFPDFVLLAL